MENSNNPSFENAKDSLIRLRDGGADPDVMLSLGENDEVRCQFLGKNGTVNTVSKGTVAAALAAACDLNDSLTKKLPNKTLRSGTVYDIDSGQYQGNRGAFYGETVIKDDEVFAVLRIYNPALGEGPFQVNVKNLGTGTVLEGGGYHPE